MRLSDTPAAEEWLKQFGESDVVLARQLLDDLVLVSPQQFMTGLRRLIEPILASEARPVAFYPIWEIQRRKTLGWSPIRSHAVEPVFPLDSRSTKSARVGRRDRIKQQVPQPKQGIAGSVGTALQLISDLRKQYGSRVLDRPALHVLLANKCNRIVLIDDLIGSGSRAIAYLEAFYIHPTIKSWCSNPGLRVTLAAYGATQNGMERIRRHRRGRDYPRVDLTEILFCQPVLSGRTYWSESHRLSIENVCKIYGRLTSRPTLPLGYEDAFSLVVFPHGIPNTAPAILWATRKDRWRALFPQRGIPVELLETVAQTSPDRARVRLSDTLLAIGQKRLAEGDWSPLVTAEFRRLIFFLAIVARGFRSTLRIAEMMEIHHVRCLRLLSAARDAGLVGPNGELTQRGVAELRYARTFVALPTEPAAIDESRMYIPKSLRGRQRSI